MNPNVKNLSCRVLVLITSPKLARKATKMFHTGAVPVHYTLNAQGTASSEMMDILGMGSIEKRILLSMLPKPFADEMLQKLRQKLRLGTQNSGIAFTFPMSGANNLMIRMLQQLDDSTSQPERKDGFPMSEIKYTMIATVVDQGYSEDVMNAARAVGATGGTVLHSRRMGDENAMNFWGLSIQEEKEIVLIVAEGINKMKIMRAIGEKCGIRTSAKGIVMSLPIDAVIGLGGYE